MKQIVLAIFSVAAVALAGCSMTAAQKAQKQDAALRKAIQKDIKVYMQTYAKSREAKPCTFEEKAVVDLYNSIPEISQQHALESVEYQLTSKDGNTTIRCMFARNRKLKITVKKEKENLEVGCLMNGDKAYVFQGTAYSALTDPLAINMLQMNYDVNMDFNAIVRDVRANIVDSCDYNLETQEKTAVRVPLEVEMDGIRCYKVTMLLSSNAYAADLIAYVDTEDHHLIRTELTPRRGLPMKNTMIAKYSNFAKTQSGFAFAATKTLAPAGKPEVPLAKGRIFLNRKYDEKTFQPNLPLVVLQRPAVPAAKTAAPAAKPAEKAAAKPAEKAAAKPAEKE